MNKVEFYRAIRSRRWSLIRDVPPNWIQVAWNTQPLFQAAALDELRTSVEKIGSVEFATRLTYILARSLTPDGVRDLYVRLRSAWPRLEVEWRASFQAAFPTVELPTPEVWATSEDYREEVVAYVASEIGCGTFHRPGRELARELAQELSQEEVLDLHERLVERSQRFDPQWQAWFETVFPVVRGLLPSVEATASTNGEPLPPDDVPF
jgi:hypothetical protein